MKLLDKKTFYEIVGIIVFSSLFGIFYNFFTSKPLPLIYTPPKVEFVSDSLWDMLNTANIEKSDANKTEEIIRQMSEVVDTKVPNFVLKYYPSKIISKIDSVYNKLSSLKDTTTKKQETEIDLTALFARKYINYEQILKFLNNQNFQFVDARSPESFAKGHIGNAVNIYPYNENKEEYLKSISMLPRNKILIIYCDGGNCDLSDIVAEEAISFGYKQVLLYHGGWEEWEKKQNIK